MKIADIYKLRGAFYNVLTPKAIEKKVRNAILIGFDTEFDPRTHELISIQLSLGIGRSKIYYLNEINAQKLHEMVLSFLRENGVEPSMDAIIYLISHFSLAEVSQVRDALKDLKLMPFHESLMAKTRGVKPEMFIRDLWAYYKMGLDKVGIAVGYPKVELDVERIDRIRIEDPILFERYALRDAEIAIEAFNRLRELIWEGYGIDVLRHPTMASTSAAIFRQNFLKEAPFPFKVEKFKRIRRRGESFKDEIEERKLFDGDLSVRQMALRCYWGGRNEAYVRGLIEEEMEYYDIISLYPSAAMLQPLPLIDTKWLKFDNLEDIKGLEGFCEVKFKCQNDLMYPPLPVCENYHDRLYFPLKGWSFCTLAEVRKAVELGAEIINIRGYGFIPSEKEVNHPLKEFFTHFMKRKKEVEHGSLEYEAHKLVMNSLIGKLCQRNPELSVEDVQWVMREQGMSFNDVAKMLRSPKLSRAFKVATEVGSTWAPEWSSLILGKARSLMIDFISKGAYFTSTDSVLYPKGVNLECESLRELESVGSGLKKEYDVDRALIIRTRCYILWKNNEIVRTARHGVHASEEDFKKVISELLKDPLKVKDEIRFKKRHIVKLGESLRRAIPFGISEDVERTFNLKWDGKRLLLNPNVNPFVEASETRPLEEAPPAKERRRRRATANDLERIRRLRKEGRSMRKIALEVGFSKSTVQRLLKEFLNPVPLRLIWGPANAMDRPSCPVPPHPPINTEMGHLVMEDHPSGF